MNSLETAIPNHIVIISSQREQYLSQYNDPNVTIIIKKELTFHNAFLIMKNHEHYKKQTIFILLFGLDSLFKWVKNPFCENNCANPYYVFQGISIEKSLKDKAILLQKKFYKDTKVDQLILCEIIPIQNSANFLSQRVVTCGHSSVILNSQNIREIYIYNEWIQKSKFSNKYNLYPELKEFHLNLKSFEINSLKNDTSINIPEVIKTRRLSQIKNLINYFFKKSVGDIKNSGQDFVQLGFEKVIIVANTAYKHCLRNMNSSKTVVLADDFVNFENIASIVGRHTLLHKSRSLWIIVSGIYMIVNTYINSQCHDLCFQPLLQVYPNLSYHFKDILKAAYNAKIKIESLLGSNSSVIFAPLIPSQIVNINLEHYMLHGMQSDNNNIVCVNENYIPQLIQMYNHMCYEWHSLTSRTLKQAEISDESLLKYSSLMKDNYIDEYFPYNQFKVSEPLRKWNNFMKIFIRNVLKKVTIDDHVTVDKKSNNSIVLTPSDKRSHKKIKYLDLDVPPECSSSLSVQDIKFDQIVFIGSKNLCDDLRSVCRCGFVFIEENVCRLDLRKVQNICKILSNYQKTTLIFILCDISVITDEVIDEYGRTNLFLRNHDGSDVQNLVSQSLNDMKTTLNLMQKSLTKYSTIILSPICTSEGLWVNPNLKSEEVLNNIFKIKPNTFFLHGIFSVWADALRCLNNKWKLFMVDVLQKANIDSSSFDEYTSQQKHITHMFTSPNLLLLHKKKFSREWTQCIEKFYRKIFASTNSISKKAIRHSTSSFSLPGENESFVDSVKDLRHAINKAKLKRRLGNDIDDASAMVVAKGCLEELTIIRMEQPARMTNQPSKRVKEEKCVSIVKSSNTINSSVRKINTKIQYNSIQHIKTEPPNLKRKATNISELFSIDSPKSKRTKFLKSFEKSYETDEKDTQNDNLINLLSRGCFNVADLLIPRYKDLKYSSICVSIKSISLKRIWELHVFALMKKNDQLFAYFYVPFLNILPSEPEWIFLDKFLKCSQNKKDFKLGLLKKRKYNWHLPLIILTCNRNQLFPPKNLQEVEESEIEVILECRMVKANDEISSLKPSHVIKYNDKQSEPDSSNITKDCIINNYSNEDLNFVSLVDISRECKFSSPTNNYREKASTQSNDHMVDCVKSRRCNLQGEKFKAMTNSISIDSPCIITLDKSIDSDSSDTSVKLVEPSSKVVSHVEPPLEVVNLVEPSSEVINLVEPSSEVVNLVEPSSEVVNLVEPSSEVVDLVEPSSEVVNLVEPSSDVVNLVEPSSEVVNLVKQSSEVVNLVEPSSEVVIVEPFSEVVNLVEPSSEVVEIVNSLESKVQSESTKIPKENVSVKIFYVSRYAPKFIKQLSSACRCIEEPIFDEDGYILKMLNDSTANIFIKVFDGKRIFDSKLSVKLIKGSAQSQETLKRDILLEKTLLCSLEIYTGFLTSVNRSKFLQELDIWTYKTLRCSKQVCSKGELCHQFHKEEDRRRDARAANNKYCSSMCKKVERGEICPLGDNCASSHNLVEKKFHPSVFKKDVCAIDLTVNYHNHKICSYIHPGFPDSFYHPCWKDVIVQGISRSLDYLVGAIRRMHLRGSGEGLTCLFLSPSVEFIEFSLNVIKPIAEVNQVSVVMAMEEEVSSVDLASAQILMGTPKLVWPFICEGRGVDSFKGLKILIVDDVPTLLCSPPQYTKLVEILDALRSKRESNGPLNVVVTSKFVEDKTIKICTNLFTTRFTELRFSKSEETSKRSAESTNKKRLLDPCSSSQTEAKKRRLDPSNERKASMILKDQNSQVATNSKNLATNGQPWLSVLNNDRDKLSKVNERSIDQLLAYAMKKVDPVSKSANVDERKSFESTIPKLKVSNENCLMLQVDQLTNVGSVLKDGTWSFEYERKYRIFAEKYVKFYGEDGNPEHFRKLWQEFRRSMESTQNKTTDEGKNIALVNKRNGSRSEICRERNKFVACSSQDREKKSEESKTFEDKIPHYDLDSYKVTNYKLLLENNISGQDSYDSKAHASVVSSERKENILVASERKGANTSVSSTETNKNIYAGKANTSVTSPERKGKLQNRSENSEPLSVPSDQENTLNANSNKEDRVLIPSRRARYDEIGRAEIAMKRNIQLQGIVFSLIGKLSEYPDLFKSFSSIVESSQSSMSFEENLAKQFLIEDNRILLQILFDKFEHLKNNCRNKIRRRSYIRGMQECKVLLSLGAIKRFI